MFENENTGSELTNEQLVDLAFSNKELQGLPLGSEEFNAAAAKLVAKTNENSDESADVTSEQETEDEVNDENDETTDVDSEDSDDHEDADEQKPVKKSRGMLRRIEKLVEEKAELKRRLEHLEGQKRLDSSTQQVEDTNFTDPKPKFADFDSLEEYTEALTEWKLEKREFEQKEAAELKELKTKQTEVVASWHEKEAAVKKEFRDYTEYVNIESLEESNPSTEARVFLAESEIGPKVLYTLLSDSELSKKFSDASSVQQVKMLTKLEMQLENSSSNKEKVSTTKISKAPNPPKNLPTGKIVRSAQDLLTNSEDMDWQEWSRKVDEVRRKK